MIIHRPGTQAFWSVVSAWVAQGNRQLSLAYARIENDTADIELLDAQLLSSEIDIIITREDNDLEGELNAFEQRDFIASKLEQARLSRVGHAREVKKTREALKARFTEVMRSFGNPHLVVASSGGFCGFDVRDPFGASCSSL